MIYRAQLSEEAVWARLDIAYLRNGDGEWEKSITLLDDILEAKTASGEDISDRDVKEVVASLDQLQLRQKDQQIEGRNVDDDREPDSMREKIEKAKELRMKDATLDLEITERAAQEANVLAKPPVIPKVDSYEGYVLGSAANIKAPKSYTLWKEQKRQEKLEDELESKADVYR